MPRQPTSEIDDLPRCSTTEAHRTTTMPKVESLRESLIKLDYQPVSSPKKLTLLLQRSVRYSYRQRCCKCLPTILCELLFPILIITILALSRYGLNRLSQELDNNDGTIPGSSGQRPCSQNSSVPPTSSKEVFAKCFRFPPSYKTSRWSFLPDAVSNRTNFVFQPISDDINDLASLARQRLMKLGCGNTEVWIQNSDSDNNTRLLKNTTVNSIIIDFGAKTNLRQERKLSYNLLVREPNIVLKNDPVDFSFISYKHPSMIADRSNTTDDDGRDGSLLPQFTDVKMFLDSLLIEYQTNATVNYELERNAMRCTPFRQDYLYTSPANLLNTLLILIDAALIIPYFILLSSLIREKNAKVKEILKVLGIEPILNNIAQGIRTILIYIILILVLCVVYKLKFNPDAYFNHVNFATLFVGNFVIALQLVAFCVMNAQLFDANIRAIIATFIIYFLSTAIHSWAIAWPAGVQYILVFISPFIAARSLFQQIALFDIATKDLHWFQTVYRRVPVFFPTLIVMLVSCLFYWVLSWYLEKVFPGQYGIPMDWNFLFKRDYWRREKTRRRQYSITNPSSGPRSATALARTNSTGTPIVHVDHLVKKFGPDKIAVNDVSFDLYANQITSLLGPNGSGKTTIFNCLIGIYQQTSGTITMESEDGTDQDTRSQIEELRKSIGYCPQHDILFDLLTIEEQLQFYAVARGFGKYKREISQEMLNMVNLQASKNTYCQALSGGMKRRLSLACAFVGDTRIILLDEPSSGLDPSNRRLLWDWLRTMKEGKTLLLTTHFMEESDALSDRIIIIANGVIKADGTSAKLKEQYGSGYKLVVNKRAHVPSNEVEKELRRYLPQLAIETDLPGGDVVFRTNQLPDEQFVRALRQLEAMKKNNQIKTYGVQNSTMDDVFLKITKDSEHEKGNGSAAVDLEQIDEQCRRVFDDRQFYHGFNYYLSQLHGLTMKTLLVRYRRWGLTLIVLLLPILYNILSNVISRSGNATGTFKMQTTDMNPQTILYQADPSIENYFLAAAGSKSSGVTMEKREQNISAMNEHIWQKRMDRLSTYTDIYLAFEVPAPTGDTFKIQTLSSNIISGYEAISVASNTLLKYKLNDTSASIDTTLIYKKTGNFSLQPNLGDILNILSIASCFVKMIPTSLILDVFVFYFIFFYIAIFLVSERKDSFLSLLNISGLHPTFYWLFNYIFDVILCVVWFSYLLMIFCIVDVAFNGSPSSRTSTAGITPIEFATSWDLRIQFYPLTILIALPTLPFVYLLTKIFKSDILGGLTICAILIIIHFVSVIVPIITMIVDNDSVRNILYWVFNIVSPSINAQAIVTYQMAQKSDFCRTFSRPSGDEPGFSFFKSIGNKTMGVNGAILILHTCLLLGLLIIIDSGLVTYVFSRLFSRLTTKTVADETRLDNDVVAERHRILNSNGDVTHSFADADVDKSDHLAVHDLVKRFRGRPLPAVNHLTFGAKRGEAFGLLGYNGAGKTTTFRILVGDETASQGTAYIDGQNVNHRLRSVRHLGYCPQQDCSMDYLTVRDGLYLLARIRGVPRHRIDSVVETISSLFLLDPFQNNYIHQLSGGTKRRLHAALALIGPPLVAILDEPTTGVDPNARQQMQEIFLNAVKAKLTIILTSHSMDECERVCNRLGIMVNGQLACLGTIQHLKSKFGQGYTVEIKVRSTPNDVTGAAMQQVQTFLLGQRQFQVEVREITYSTGSFQIRQGTPADLFEVLEQNKRQLNIETYTISQTSLEQIFLSFGKHINQV